MNYSSFCDYLFASLMNQMERGATISKEKIRKNNNVSLDAFVIHIPDSASSPVVYLQPLYQNYLNGSSIEKIAQMVLAKLKREIPLSLELAEQVRSFDTTFDRIAFRLVSRKNNEDLLKDVPWVPYLDLAVIFYLHLGVKDDKQITTLIHNHQAKSWNLSPDALFNLAKLNTPRLCPSTIGCLEHMLLGWDDEEDRIVPCESPLPTLYVLSNTSGINGASCLLYEGIIKDFADQIGSDLIILPSSIHEVLILPDSHDSDYENFRRMIQNVNAEDVPEEDILSDELYLYRRDSASIIIWPSCESDNAGSCGRQNL